MDEAEKPDPSKPWCPKCIGHTPFQTKKYNTENGTRESHLCQKCNGTKMHIPGEMALGKIICGYAGVASLLLGIGGTLFEEDPKIFYWFGGLGLAFIFMYWWANRRFSKWRGWAKENGYTEE